MKVMKLVAKVLIWLVCIAIASLIVFLIRSGDLQVGGPLTTGLVFWLLVIAIYGVMIAFAKILCEVCDLKR